MKKADLFNLFHGLKAVATFPGVKFAYAVARNISVVQKECELLEQSAAPSDAFKEYDQKRVALATELCDKNEDGSPKTMTANGQEVFVFAGGVMSPAWETAIKGLNDEYSEVIDARMHQVDEFNKLLEEETDVTLFKVNAEQLPEGINAAQIKAVMAIIED